MNTRIVPLMAAALLTGCCYGGRDMLKTDSPVAATPADKATVVFLRPSRQSGIHTRLYDVTDGRLDFLGNTARCCKLAVVTSPGQHVFMVYDDRHHGKKAAFLKADLAASKTYYVLLKPRFGDLFGLKPLRHADIASADFPEWIRNTQSVIPGPAALKWAEANKTLVASTREIYWADFLKSTHPDEHVLNAEDGDTGEAWKAALKKAPADITLDPEAARAACLEEVQIRQKSDPYASLDTKSQWFRECWRQKGH